MVVAKKPVDQLRDLSAPRDLIEWVRKLAPETAARSSWVDANRADWMPYLAAMRGINQDLILRAICECALDVVGSIEGPEGARILGVLRETSTGGRSWLKTTEHDFNDLKLAIIAWGHRAAPGPRPMWMYWAELVLELARAAGRGNMLVGMSLGMRLLANANTITKPGARPAHMELVARLRDKLTLAG